MSNFIFAFGAAILISLISLLGVLFLVFKKEKTEKLLIFLVSFSAGGLLGGAFFHLLPEAIEESNNLSVVFYFVIAGIILFFLLEKILRWHHCHKVDCETHKHLGYLNLFGDGIHNFIDGIIIASAFSIDIKLGLAIVMPIIFHEIPQEIGDFGVLLYAGFSRTRALFYNFVSALLALAGVFTGFLLSEAIFGFNKFLLPFAAGGFIYIAASDLIPELHKETNIKKSCVSFAFFVLALVFMALIKE